MMDMLRSFQPQKYLDGAQENLTKVFKRLIILAIITAVLLSGKYVAFLSNAGDEAVKWSEANLPEVLREHLPEIDITEGVLSSPIAQPYIRKLSDIDKSEVKEDEDFAIVLDTTGEIQSLDDYPQGILILADRVILKTRSDQGVEERREFSFEDMDIKSLNLKPSPNSREILSLVINGQAASFTYDHLKTLKGKITFWAYPIFLLVLTFYYFVAKIVIMYAFSLYALFFNKITNRELSYRKLLDITSLAVIPPTVMSLVYNLFNLKFPYLSFAYIGFVIIMLTLAMKGEKSA